MAITRVLRVPKVTLPAATLYLDDIEEIIGVLKAEDGDPPILEFVVDDQRCDSLDDLRKIGGQTANFTMDVHWRAKFTWYSLRVEPRERASIFVSGPSVQRQAWVTSQTKEIFDRRSGWIERARWIIVALLFLLILALPSLF
jgi:hypothetical protein